MLPPFSSTRDRFPHVGRIRGTSSQVGDHCAKEHEYQHIDWGQPEVKQYKYKIKYIISNIHR